MKGTFQIAKLFNIPVKVHWSFVLIIVWVIFSGYSEGLGSGGTFWLSLLMLGMFVCVVMHEYGHALTARRFGVNTKDIILLPIGGVARLDKLPEKPLEELLVAIAGPLVNIGIAIVLSTYFFFEPLEGVRQTIQYEGGATVARTFVPYLILLNVVLAVFNLIPAFPMDGGRVLRALLAMRMSRVKATRIASIVGQIFAVCFVIASIYPLKSPIFTLLGVFIFFIAYQENKSTKKEQSLHDLPLSEVYRSDFTRLEMQDTMRSVLAVSEIKKENSFLVFNEENQVIGVIHDLFLKEAVQQNDLDAPVAAYMSQHFDFISSSDSTLNVLQAMQTEGYSIIPVLENGIVIGVIDKDGIKNFI